MAEPEEFTIPILLLGDSEVGKSSFIARLTRGLKAAPYTPLPTLQDLDQPYIFEIYNYNRTRKYRLEFSDTSSPENYTLLHPSMIILCFSIADRKTLTSLHQRWKYELETHFNYNESLPIMVLGLKRDLRGDGRGEGVVFPQVALRVAQEMRCDRYAECSAVSGEFCAEAWEDLVKMAVGTLGDKGGKSDGTTCCIM